jgi:hypothetical protein
VRPWGLGCSRPAIFVRKNGGEFTDLAVVRIGKKRLKPNSLERF